MWPPASRRVLRIHRWQVSGEPVQRCIAHNGWFSTRESASPRCGAGRAANGRRAARGGGKSNEATRRRCRPAPPVASFHKKWRTSYILNHFNLGISYSTPWDTGVPSWRFSNLINSYGQKLQAGFDIFLLFAIAQRRPSRSLYRSYRERAASAMGAR